MQNRTLQIKLLATLILVSVCIAGCTCNKKKVAGTDKEFSPDRRGLVNDIYNPPYFQDICSRVAETQPLRECLQPMYGHGCLNTASVIYGAPVGFWTSQFGDRIPAGGGAAARSAVWGFEPVFFKPSQVQEALEVILFEEWKLPREE